MSEVESSGSNSGQQQLTKQPINGVKLDVDETIEQVRARNLKEAMQRAEQLPPGGLRNASDPPPPSPVYRPPPQQPVDPKLEQAYRLGYDQSRIEHYTQGFIGAITLFAAGYLGYRGVCWAFPSKPKPIN